MFKAAAALPEAPKAKKGKAKQEIAVPGVQHLAMVDALSKALETVKGTLESGVKQFALDHFTQAMALTGTKPDSFRAVEGDAAASLELRKRGSNLALSPAAVALLQEHGFEPAREVIVPQLYGINPAHASNEELLGKVEAALKGIVPADFIILQPEQIKYIVNDELLAKVCAAKTAPVEVVQVVTTLACKPALKQTNITAILDFVRDLLTGPTPQPAANEPEKAKAAA